MAELSKTDVFVRLPIPKAVMSMAIPTITSSLVMVLYNLAETSAVTLAAPLLLAFNAATTSSAWVAPP